MGYGLPIKKPYFVKGSPTMYSDLDIVYARITDSANYSKQCYQKLVERSIDEGNSTGDFKNTNEQINLDGAHFEMREPLE